MSDSVTPAAQQSDLATTHTYKVAPNSVMAKVMLAFLTTAGIFYINIMPAVVSGLIEALGFTNKEAGFVSSANLYGASIGSLVAVFIIKKIRWQRWAYCLLIALLAIDFASMHIDSPWPMIVIRALHGLTGGLLVGIGFSIISRTQDPDKTFGYLLLIQWGLGGLGLMYLPGLVPSYGTGALFCALIAFSFVALVMLIFLPHYEVEKANKPIAVGTAKNHLLLILTLVAIFLFQGANMGLFAYMIALGLAANLDMDFMSASLGMASWVALVGAALVIIIGKKFGRLGALMLGISVTAVCSWLLIFSDNSNVYLYANIVIGIGWAFVLPYMFGICSELDIAGQFAAMGGFASKMGLASGPMVAALVLSGEQYNIVIYLAVVFLIGSAICVLKPARTLDKHAQS
ncbi:MFS transporter [Pseudoalteromonas pernae]|uniref:MFS transporter n=1 Tax=Pseudoalteromonas pernae TaxID=3118054 RepID=UPI003242082E